MDLTQRTITKGLKKPMIFPKFKINSKNYTIQPKHHKTKDLSLFTQGVFNFSSPKWEPYIEKHPQDSLYEFSSKNGPNKNREII